MTLLNYSLFTPEDPEAQKETPLFILHGLLGSMDNWRTQAKNLSKNRPVYTLDLRNHGNSPHLDGMSYREMYEDVLRVVEHEKIDSFHLLGHSMGGKVSMHLSLARPEMIKSLIIVDIAPKPYPLWHQKTLQGVMEAPIADFESRKEVDEFLKPWIGDHAERTFILMNLKRADDGKGFKWRCNMQEISKNYLKIAAFTTALEQFTGNCLFVRGEKSNYVLESDEALIKSIFTKARVLSMTNSGHLPHVQEPALFFDEVNNFLNET